MAQSISQAQAANLGFLDTVGGGKEGFVPRETASTMVQLAQDIIDQVAANLDAGGHNSSGALSSSFHMTEPEINGDIITLNIMALDYYDYINKGVRGTKSGMGPYSFKNDNPSLKMVQSISDWAGRSFFSSRNIKVAVTATERKHKAVASLSKMAKAYAIARSIKQKGIKGSGYLDKAINVAKLTMTDRIGAGLAVDITRTLPKTIG